MTDREPDQDALAAAETMTDAVKALTDEVARLRKSQRRSWKFIVFDITLTLALALVGGISVHAAQTAGQANSAQLALCQAGNVARAQQVELWDYVLSITGKPATPRQQKATEEFKHHLNVIFAPRNCEQIGKGG